MSDTSTHHPHDTLKLRCARCSHALRGLESGGRCPECGLEISQTIDANRRRCGRLLLRARRLRGPLISRTDRPWLRRTAVAVVSLCLAQAGLVIWHAQWVPSGMYRRSKVPDYQLFYLALWQTLSLWVLTWPEPGAKHRSVRRVLRACSLATPAAAGLGLASELVPFDDHAFYAALARVPALLVPVVVFLTFDDLAFLAARVRDRLAVIGLRAARLVGTVFAAMAVAAGVIAGHRVAEVTADALGALYAYGGLGMVCYGLLCVLLLRVAWKLWTGAARTQ